MHYYPHDIGKYRRKTGHLTFTEHGIYRTLLDTYYLQEGPLDLDVETVMRHHGIRSDEQRRAFFNVLADFFTESEDGYRNDEADEQLEKIYQKSDKARRSAEARWEKMKSRRKHANASKNDANASKSDANACETQAKTMLLKDFNTLPLKETPSSSEAVEEVDPEKAEDERLARYMFAHIRQVIPKAKEPKFDNWANVIRLMREQDKLTRKEIAAVFLWANRDDFWSTNIRSPDKLRKQFAVLDAKRQRNETGQRSAGQHESRSDRIDRKLAERFGTGDQDQGDQ